MFVGCFVVLSVSLTTQAQNWQPVTTQNTCAARHENAATLVGDSLYAIGGRGMKPLEALNLKTLVWQTLLPPPIEMNHFQAVSYPHEAPIPTCTSTTPNGVAGVRDRPFPPTACAVRLA